MPIYWVIAQSNDILCFISFFHVSTCFLYSRLIPTIDVASSFDADPLEVFTITRNRVMSLRHIMRTASTLLDIAITREFKSDVRVCLVYHNVTPCAKKKKKKKKEILMSTLKSATCLRNFPVSKRNERKISTTRYTKNRMNCLFSYVEFRVSDISSDLYACNSAQKNTNGTRKTILHLKSEQTFCSKNCTNYRILHT